MDRTRGRRGARRRRVPCSVAGALAASLVLTACGGDGSSSTSSSTTSPSSGAVLPGGGLSVAEAIATSADPPLAVTGWLVRTEDGPRLCSSYDATAGQPCGEPSLALEGEVTEGTGEKISLLGSVDGDVFVPSSNARG